MRRGHAALWALIGTGTLIRLIWAFTTDGSDYDVTSFLLVRDALREHGLDVYSFVNSADEFYRWPYPPGFFPWIGLSALLDGPTGISFPNLLQLAPIAADAAIAWLVADILAARGASERTCLVGAGLVALGPSFILISGYHDQIDSVAILPAVAALAGWERAGPDRAWQAGLLVGAGAAIKTVPILMLVALLPTLRDRREAVLLVGCALAVPLVLLAPFIVADADGVRTMLGYKGAPGAGGLTLAVQPELAKSWLTEIVPYNAVNEWIVDNGGVLNAAVVAVVGIFLLRFRVGALQGACVLWLALWAFGSGFFVQYLVWGLPFLLAAGYLRSAAALQVVMIVPAVLFYSGPWEDQGVVVLYAAVMLVVWAAWVTGLALIARRVVVGPGRPAEAA
jgi:hypothetical protein